jgi:hypothetical protein
VQLRTMRKLGPVIWLFVLIPALATAANAHAQRENEMPPPQEHEYGSGFFDQLRLVFGRFQEADLQRVFQTARPIKCSDLVTDKGEWRDVAFFNENRKLGDWYRKSLDEVKHDLAVYVFRGTCGGADEHIRVTTKFPVYESIKAYQEGRIRFQELDVNVNAPANLAFNPQTRAYAFDLPYLFRVANQDGDPLYTLNPRHLSDEYARNVASHWECKAVTADDVTYQFLICRTTLIPLGTDDNSHDRNRPFGASAYSILSDGKEASSTVKLTIGVPADSTPSAAK